MCSVKKANRIQHLNSAYGRLDFQLPGSPSRLNPPQTPIQREVLAPPHGTSALCLWFCHSPALTPAPNASSHSPRVTFFLFFLLRIMSNKSKKMKNKSKGPCVYRTHEVKNKYHIQYANKSIKRLQLKMPL